MYFQKLNKKDFLYLITVLIVLVFALFFIQKYHKIAFPGQSINFQLSKEDAFSKADNFLDKQDIDIKNFDEQVGSFDFPQQTKIFIEKELGIEKSHAFFSRDFNIWQWSVRYFSPMEEEEIKLSYSTDGDLRFFNHIIPEEEAINSISSETAVSIAEEFTNSWTSLNSSQWELKEKSSESKKFRVDHSFTYQKKNVEIYGAHFEFTIKIYGDQVGYFHEYLKVPEYWERDYKKLRSQNDTTHLIAFVFLLILAISSIIFFIYTAIKKSIKIKTALIFGAITSVIYLISQINMLPIELYYFETNQSLANFYIDLIIGGIIGAIMYGAIVFFLAASGERLYKEFLPKKNRLLCSFSKDGMKSKEFFNAVIIGFVSAFLFISFQIIFYMIAEGLGAWSPATVSYSEIINTKFPWIFILFSGFIPAVTEEFCFRLYGIPIVNKFSKSKLFAVLITAVIWGFAHSNYPNQPFWIRGLEISLFGIAAGYLFIYFGIVATLVWHFTVDAFLTVIMFAKSGNLQILIPSYLTVGIAIFFLAYNIFFYFKNKGFLVADKILNESDVPDEKVTTVQETEIIHHKSVSLPTLSRKKTYFILAVIAIFFASCFLPVKKLGSYFKYNTPQQEILDTARNFLHEQGIDPDRFHTAISIDSDCSNSCLKYITVNTSLDTANFIFANYLPNIVSYKVRFYNEQEKEEFLVFIHPMDNYVTAFEHKLEEKAMSYDLSQELAQLKVEQYLVQQNFDLKDFNLIESYAEVLPNRTDHTFTYESVDEFPANIKEARLRLSFIIKGDEIGYFKSWYKVPSAWTREETKQTPMDSIRRIMKLIALPILFFILLLRYKNHFNFRTINWKIVFLLTACFFAISLIADLSTIRNHFIDYDTSWTISNYTIFFIFSTLINKLFTSLLFLMILIIGFAYYGDKNLISDLQENQKIGFDIILTSLLSSTGLIAILNLKNYIAGVNPELISTPEIFLPDYLVYSLFIANISTRIIFLGIISSVIFYSIISILFKNKYLSLISLVVMITVLPNNVDTLPEFLFSYLSIIIVILWLYMSHKFFLRNNLLAYLFAGISFFIISTSNELISTGYNRAIVGSYFLIALLLMFIIWLLIKDKTNWYERMTNQ